MLVFVNELKLDLLAAEHLVEGIGAFAVVQIDYYFDVVNYQIVDDKEFELECFDCYVKMAVLYHIVEKIACGLF